MRLKAKRAKPRGTPFSGKGDPRNGKGPIPKEAHELRAEFTRAMAQQGSKGRRFETVADLIWTKAATGVPYFVGIVVDMFGEKSAQEHKLSGEISHTLSFKFGENGNGKDA